MTGLPHDAIAGHAIRRVTIDRAETRSYLVCIECDCGSIYRDMPAADFSGVLDVAIQAFFAHIAAAALPHVE